MTYVQALISAELRPQGLNILDHLIQKRLAFDQDGVFADRESLPPPTPKDAMASLKFMPTSEIPGRTKSSFAES
jgi:hypothetical protein